MPYYVWKRNGEVVAHAYSADPRPAPAIEITDDEAKELGIYVPQPTAPPAPEEPTEAKDTAAMLVDHEYRLTLMELGLNE